MAVQKIQIKPPDNNYSDVLHPETDTLMVLLPDGVTTLATKLTGIDNELAEHEAEVTTLQAHTAVSNIHTKVTSGTANPVGGVNGDVYLQYEA
jgi:Mg-chelatase subunit ChlD